MSERVLSVSQLNSYIKRMLDNDLLLSGVWLKGEISNFKHHTSGHMYMTLKDEQSAVRAVMFKGATFSLKFKPEDGMKVLVFGRVSVFESAGQYQVYIEAMQPDGLGSLYVAYEQMKARLEEEGLFSSEHKKKIPEFPEKIAVVTSPTGAAIQDILNVLGRRYPYADVVVIPVLVQGDGAAEQIADAIEYVNKKRIADVMIVGRGGGSIEDLWAFNEEVCARAIYNSEIPVISAVGHETDFTIADFVADMRAPTPSAAAELAVPSMLELKAVIENLKSRMLTSAKSLTERKREVIKQKTSRISVEGVLNNYNQKRMLLDSKFKRAEQLAERLILTKKTAFAETVGKLDALSPLAVLSRGFTVTKTLDGKMIQSISNIKTGDEISTVLNDGIIKSVILETERK
ncbi:MAG: exodeoxyribonuclease VII large subunit [Clostridia bacterium]|nr:exodeoxyribonuclease VII large subunit [Clostridia bacterium]